MRFVTTDEQDREYAELLAEAKRREEACAQNAPDLHDIERRLVDGALMELPIGWHAFALTLHTELLALLPRLRYARAEVRFGGTLCLDPYPELGARCYARPGEPYMAQSVQDALLGAVSVGWICAWCGLPGRSYGRNLPMCDVHSRLSYAAKDGMMDGPSLRLIRDHFNEQPPNSRSASPVGFRRRSPSSSAAPLHDRADIEIGPTTSVDEATESLRGGRATVGRISAGAQSVTERAEGLERKFGVRIFMCGVESHQVSGTTRTTQSGSNGLSALVNSTNARDWHPADVWEIEEQLKADASHLRDAATSCLSEDDSAAVGSCLEHSNWPKDSAPGVRSRAYRGGSVSIGAWQARAQLARVMNNLGVLFLLAGTWDDALFTFQVTRPIFDGCLPQENRNLGGLLNNTAQVHLSEENRFRTLNNPLPSLADERRVLAEKYLAEAASLGYK